MKTQENYNGFLSSDSLPGWFRSCSCRYRSCRNEEPGSLSQFRPDQTSRTEILNSIILSVRDESLNCHTCPRSFAWYKNFLKLNALTKGRLNLKTAKLGIKQSRPFVLNALCFASKTYIRSKLVYFLDFSLRLLPLATIEIKELLY